jgi:Tol biopolymer transport system component
VYEPSVDGRIAVVDTDGKGPAQMLSPKLPPAVSEGLAAWSPDGKEIAFIRSHEDEGSSAWIMGADGSNRRLVAPEAEDVAFSPDGKSVLYVAAYPQKRALYRVPLSGGESRLIGPAPPHGFAKEPSAVEPGGKRVIKYVGGSVVVSRPGGPSKKMVPDPYEDASPLWSPDGTRIAFSRGSEGRNNWDVYIVGAYGKGERRIAPDGSPVWLRDGRLLISYTKGFAIADVDPDRIAMPVDGGSRAISPDGKWIAFLRNRAVHGAEVRGGSDLVDVQSTLFLQRADGTGLRALAKTPGNETTPSLFDAPVWAPDGRSILIAESDPMDGGSARIRQIPVGDGEEKTVAHAEFSSLEYLAVAPNGKRIAFATVGTNTSIDVVRLDDLQRKTVVPFDRVDAEALKWSPDGDKLAYVVSDYENESVFELYVIDADGSHRRLVSKPGDAVGTFDWAPAP